MTSSRASAASRSLRRAGSHDPCHLHLWQAGDLGQAAEGEGQDCMVRREALDRSAVMRVIEKNFVGDDGERTRSADPVQLLAFLRRHQRSGRIVGMHHHHGARPGRDGAIQRVHVDQPAVVVDERIGHQTDILQARQELKQRIAGRGHQDFVAGVAQQAEQVGVGLAGARGQQHARRRDHDAEFGVIAAHRFTRGQQPERLRSVFERLGIHQRAEDSGRIVGHAGSRRIRLGQVEHFPAVPPALGDRLRQPVDRQVPVGATREHTSAL